MLSVFYKCVKVISKAKRLFVLTSVSPSNFGLSRSLSQVNDWENEKGKEKGESREKK